MKAFALRSPGVADYINATTPDITPYSALLKPIIVSVCTSDIHTIYGTGSPKKPDLILGHECVAQVVAVGQYVNDFNIGDIVAVPSITPDCLTYKHLELKIMKA